MLGGSEASNNQVVGAICADLKGSFPIFSSVIF
jgi:hypothetical protein